jgi:hypothetical protein
VSSEQAVREMNDNELKLKIFNSLCITLVVCTYLKYRKKERT